MSEELKHNAPTKGPGTITIPNIELEPFERAVYSRQHEQAGQMLVQILAQLRLGAEVVGYTTDVQTKQVLYTRLAAAITALVSDPKFILSQEGFDRIAAEHATMDTIFRASAFNSSDHLARQFSEWDPQNPQAVKFRDSPNLGKFLLTYSLSSQLRLNFDKLFKLDARLTFPLYAGMLSHLSVLTDPAHVRREYLLSLHKLFEKVSVNDATLLVMSDAYMYTSYAVREEKHRAKATLNRITKRFINRHYPGNVDKLAPRPQRDKPLLLVGLEWFTFHHAMYRCFAPAIESLRETFYVVGMARRSEVDDESVKLFHEFVELPDQVNLVAMAQRIHQLAPDMIFYPSVGMSYWWMAMSTCRLAPVQVLGVGHPASTFSPEMDYVVAEEGIFAKDGLASEMIIELPTGSTRFVMRRDVDLEATRAAQIDVKLREEQDLEFNTPANTLHIAVPAMAVKLNTPFIDVLARIEQGTQRPIVWHFFPNQLGATQFVIEKDLRYKLKHPMNVYGRLHYQGYQEHLKKCELHLSPFPFGGTNSNIDSMLLGIPIIALKGAEPHATSDALMLERIDLKELIVTTPDEYVALALRLIDHDDVRRLYSEVIKSRNIERFFFGPGEGEIIGAWVRAFDVMYRNREELHRMRKDGFERVRADVIYYAERAPK